MDSIIVAVATTISICASLYLFALSRVAFLKKNWVEYRCNPIYMPMAGLVGQDIVKNFTQCTIKGFHDYAGFIMDPLMGEFSVVNDTLSEVGTAMNSMRGMMGSVRSGFLGIIGSVFGKIENLMSEFQYLIIRMRTLVSRLVGIMVTFVAVFTTGGQTAESVMNGPIMKVVSFLCFDSNTEIRTYLGKYKKITDLNLGDRLIDGSRVKSLYQFTGDGVAMYDLNGTRVSGEHKVKNSKGKFIKVKDHLLARKTTNSKMLVCINTTSNRIYCKGHVFLDFDEVNNDKYTLIKNRYISDLYNLNSPLKINCKSGIDGSTIIPLVNGVKTINNVVPGDILDNTEKVIGIAIHKVSEDTFFSMNGIVGTRNTLIHKIDGYVSYEEAADECHLEPGEKFIVYQLITESSSFPALDRHGNRMQIVDELQTTDNFLSEIKESMIVSH